MIRLFLKGGPIMWPLLITSIVAMATVIERLLFRVRERFRRDPAVSRALLNLAKHQDSRRCLKLMDAILETPELAEKLLHVLRPQQKSAPEMSEA